NQTVANLPRGTMMDDVTLDEAVALLIEKGKTLKPRGAAARKAKAKNGRAGAKAAAVTEAPPKARAAPRKKGASRSTAKTAPPSRKKATAKKKTSAKKAKGRAAR